MFWVGKGSMSISAIHFGILLFLGKPPCEFGK